MVFCCSFLMSMYVRSLQRKWVGWEVGGMGGGWDGWWVGWVVNGMGGGWGRVVWGLGHP